MKKYRYIVICLVLSLFSGCVNTRTDSPKKLVDKEKAEETENKLTCLHPSVNPEGCTHPAMDRILKVMEELDSAEDKWRKGEDGWQKGVGRTLPELDRIMKKEGEGYIPFYAILASVEKLKALVLLGKFVEAENVIKEHKDMIRSLDSVFKDAGLFYDVPSAKMYLWIAELNLAQGKIEKDKEKRIKFNFNAIKDFYRIIITYDQQECRYTEKAALGFYHAKKALEKDGKKLKIPEDSPLESRSEQMIP